MLPLGFRYCANLFVEFRPSRAVRSSLGAFLSRSYLFVSPATGRSLGGAIMKDSASPTISQKTTAEALPGEWTSNIKAWLVRNRLVLVLTLIFCAITAGTLWHLSRLSWRLVESSALQAASQYAGSLRELRRLYTSDVTDRLRGHGIEITHDYATKEGAIPLPATFTMELSERISQQSSGTYAR